MLIGRFGNTSGRPFVAAHVNIPSQRVFGEVSLLVDTGADSTVLMPVDADRLGVQYGRLTNTTTSTGMGGESEDFLEQAQLVFRDDADVLHIYDIALVIAKRRSDILILPSLLGRDVISRWRLLVDKSANLLTAEIVSSDDQMHP
jgi:predicted aspartyl protease